jgi:hypothetical protein
MVRLSKQTEIEMFVAVAPPIVQKVKGMVVGWEKTSNQFIWLNVRKH